MTTYYVPGVEETDLKKVIRSLQNIGGAAATATDNIATNTTNIATNTASLVPLIGRHVHGDSNYTILASDVPFLQLSANLTAPRTWTLPLSNSLPAGTLLTIQDGGGINGANTLTIQRQSTDTFLGIGVAANAITIGTVSGSVSVRNDGASGWYLVGKT